MWIRSVCRRVDCCVVCAHGYYSAVLHLLPTCIARYAQNIMDKRTHACDHIFAKLVYATDIGDSYVVYTCLRWVYALSTPCLHIVYTVPTVWFCMASITLYLRATCRLLLGKPGPSRCRAWAWGLRPRLPWRHTFSTFAIHCIIHSGSSRHATPPTRPATRGLQQTRPCARPH